MTKTSEKTTPVNAIMPEAIEESITTAATGLIPDLIDGSQRLSNLGSVNATKTARTAYETGMPQLGNSTVRRRGAIDSPKLFPLSEV
jgi:hypothetical protein